MAVNRKRIYVTGGIILLVILAVLLKFRNTSFSKNEQIKALQEIGVVDKIEITTPEGAFSFEKVDQNWQTSSNDESIDERKVNNLLKLLGQLEIHSPVSKSKYAEYSNSLTSESKEISVFSGNRNVFSITVISVGQKDIGTSNGESLFFLNLRGNTRTSLYEEIPNIPEEFYDNILINLSADQVSAVQIEYPKVPQNGFTIMYTDEAAVLFNNNKQKVDEDPVAISDYRHFFMGIRYEQIDTLFYSPDLQDHLFRLKLTSNVEKIYHIDGFILKDKISGAPLKNEFGAIVNNKIMVQLKYADFDPLLLDLEYFLKK